MKLSLLHNVIEELAARYKLHHHENICRCRDDLIQLDDVRMTKQLEILNLPTNLSHHIEALNFLSIENLNCHFVLRDYVLADFDFSERSI